MAARSKRKEDRPHQIMKSGALIAAAIAAFALLIYYFALQGKVSQQNAVLEAKQAQIQEYEDLNRDLQDKLDNQDAYVAQEARRNGYVSPNADVYVEDNP